MIYDETAYWSKIDEANLSAEKNRLIDSLKGIEYDVAKDSISDIQDKLYRAFSIFYSYRALVMRKVGELTSSQEEDDPRISGVLRDVQDKIIWEKVYSANNEESDFSGLQTDIITKIKEAILKSTKNIWFEVFLENHLTVEKKLLETLQNVHHWRKMFPEKARPIMAYDEWLANYCREIGLSALRDTLNNDGRIKGLIDSL